MAFDISTLVTDRKQSDVVYVKQLIAKIVAGTATEPELAEWKSLTLKGAYNYTDLNRVSAAMEYLRSRLNGYGYATPGYQRIEVPHRTVEVSKLPEGFTELAYIQSSGTQYIDTEFKPNQYTRVVFDTEVTQAAGYLYGAKVSTGSNFFAVGINGAQKMEVWFYSLTNVTIDTAIKRRTVDQNKNVVITSDGYTATASATTFQSDNSMFLFCINNNGSLLGGAKTKMYSCQIYDNGTIVRDYLPCINPSGEVGLYDLVDGVFCGNAGTGAFVAGMPVVKLPDGYKQVEYIQSSGTQYINTGVIGRLPVSVSLKMRTGSGMSSTDTVMLGMYQADAHATPIYLFNGTWYVSVGSTGKASPGGYLADNTDYEVESTLTTTGYNVTVNGTTVINGTATSSSGGTNILYLFARNDFGTATRFASARLYYCNLYQNNVLVRAFVPCINPSGAYGLYDLVNAQFYGNAGSGSFTGGAVVAPPVPSAPSDDETRDPFLWYEDDIPTATQMAQYILNVAVIRDTMEVLPTTPATPSDMEGLTVEEANTIEFILIDVETLINNMSAAWFYSGDLYSGEV